MITFDMLSVTLRHHWVKKNGAVDKKSSITPSFCILRLIIGYLIIPKKTKF